MTLSKFRIKCLFLRIRILFDFFCHVDIFDSEFLHVNGSVTGVLAAIWTTCYEFGVFAFLIFQVVDAEEADVVLATLTLHDNIKIPQANRTIKLKLFLILCRLRQEIFTFNVLNLKLSLHYNITLSWCRYDFIWLMNVPRLSTKSRRRTILLVSEIRMDFNEVSRKGIVSGVSRFGWNGYVLVSGLNYLLLLGCGFTLLLLTAPRKNLCNSAHIFEFLLKF